MYLIRVVLKSFNASSLSGIPNLHGFIGRTASDWRGVSRDLGDRVNQN